MKNKYTKLPIPEDSAWGKTTWRKYVHWRIKYFIDGVYNIIRWIPTIYHDRDWDDHFITKILQKKIEHQRKYLVEANRHMNIKNDNFWMTVVLNLIELEHEEFYGCEYIDYYSTDPKDFLSDKMVVDNLNDYINKYPLTKRRVIRENKGTNFTDKRKLAFYMSGYRQRKCRQLIFEILKQKSQSWWD